MFEDRAIESGCEDHSLSSDAERLTFQRLASPISIRALLRAEAASIVQSARPSDEFLRLRGIIARAGTDAAAALVAGGLVEDYEQRPENTRQPS